MLETIFREYDIRGKVGTELFIDQVYDLACAIAYYFVQQRGSAVKTVVVGMDGRVHSPETKKQVCKALIDSGLNVVFIGVCTSPALYFALYTMSVDAGLMITASHNPKEYNGFKICLGKASVWGVQVREIKDLFFKRKRIETTHRGVLVEHAVITEYVAWLAHHFRHLKGMALSVVIDCGNGAAGSVLPQLVQAMEWQNVQLLYADIDGDYPNHEADPVKEKNMVDVKNILATTSTQLGIGLDGDADRMVPMTKKGYLIPGDKVLSFFARQVLQENPGATIVADIKSSSGLLELLVRLGARPHLSPSGHAIIKDQMRTQGAILGGELSCHFFFADRYFGYDDGIYAMLRLFEIVESGVSLESMLADFPHKVSSSEILIQCPEEKKRAIIQEVRKFFAARTDATMITIDGVRATMSYGWGIVRASNTQPMLSLRFESDSIGGLDHVKHDFITALEGFVDIQLLHDYTI